MSLTDEEIKIAKAAKAEYMREYNKRNKERKKEADLKYWLNKAREKEYEKTVEQERNYANSF